MLNESLRQRRKAMGWTQEQLAEKVHVSRQTISNWENGRANPDYEMLKTLAELLETPLTELLGVEKQLVREVEETPEEQLKSPETSPTPVPSPENVVQPRWRIVLLGAAVAVMVFAVQGIINWWQQRPVASPYQPDWFMEELPAEEGKAHIVMNVLETPVEPQRYSPDYGYRWEYQVYVRETGGVGFIVDRLVEYTFMPNGGYMVNETPGFHLQSSQMGSHVSANAVCYFICGDSSREPIAGRGILMEATDENGNHVTARCYVPYALEADE